jgi:hypothetical protein
VRRCWDGKIIRRNIRPVNELWRLAAHAFVGSREKVITFRLYESIGTGRGKSGQGSLDSDDFVEDYNNSDSPHTVAASDISAGYGIFRMGGACGDTPVLVGTIPNGTVIPARGHYLFVGSPTPPTAPNSCPTPTAAPSKPPAAKASKPAPRSWPDIRW